VVLAARPVGRPRPSDFRIEPAPVEPPAPGEVQVAVHYVSVDPMLALLMGPRPLGGAVPPLPLGATVPGAASGIVVSSNDPRFSPGDAVEGRLGWQERANVPGGALRKIDRSHLATALGALGLPGFSAWCGLRLVGPLEGKTVLISGASGAVGSIAGQLARSAGAHVVGIAAGEAKCRHLTEGLGFHAAIDRTSVPASAWSERHAGQMDVYFDNVGGDMFFDVMPTLRRGATVLVCGLMAEYADPVTPGSRTAVLTEVMARQLRVIGFSNRDHVSEMPAFEREMEAHLRRGTVKLDQDLRHGLEGAIDHMAELFSGGVGGKRLVQLV
jgi:NADPH-dependent curcumin reductase CurA